MKVAEFFKEQFQQVIIDEINLVYGPIEAETVSIKFKELFIPLCVDQFDDIYEKFKTDKNFSKLAKSVQYLSWASAIANERNCTNIIKEIAENLEHEPKNKLVVLFWPLF